MDNLKKYIGLLTVFVVVASLVIAASSSSGEFTVSADSSTVNWANTSGMGSYAVNVTITNNNATRNITVLALNASSSVQNSTFSGAPFTVLDSNSTLVTNSSSENVTLNFLTTGLAPGKYTGSVYFQNETNSSENASLSFTLHVPMGFDANNIGYFSGNLTNTSTETYYFNASEVNGAAGFNITMSSLTENFTFTVYDNASTQIATRNTNTTGGTSMIWNATESGHSFPFGGMWYIQASSGITNSSINFTGTIELIPANLRVNNSFTSGTAPISENRGYNKTFTYQFDIENYGSENVTIMEILNNSNFLNNSNYYIPWSHDLANGTIITSSGTTVTLTMTLNTSETGNTLGTYRGWLFLNTSTGYPRTTYNLSIEVALSSSISVSVTNVMNSLDSSKMINTSNIVNLTVAPTYQNGTVASGLYGNNFTVTLTHVNLSSCTPELVNVNKTNESSSAYIIQGGLPSTDCGKSNAIVGGNYTVNVAVVDNNTNSGNADWNDTIMINRSAMEMRAYNTGNSQEITSITQNTGTTLAMAPKIYNYGPEAGTGVLVNYSVSGACTFTSGNNPLYINSGTVPAWSTGSINGSAWTFTMSSTAGTCSINLTGYSTTGTWSTWSRIISVTVTNSTGGGTTGGGGGDQVTGTNTTSSSTVDVDLSIMSWPKGVSIVQGKSASVDVKVQNSGSKSITDVQTKVEGIGTSWWKGTLLTTLLSGDEYVLPVTFTIPEDAEVKEYPITYVAASANATARASATLSVLPSEATEKTIEENFNNLTNKYDELLNKLEEMASTGKNVSLANSTLMEAKSLIDKANDYANAKDWFNVNGLLDQIESALNNAETKMNALTEETGMIDLSNLDIEPTYLMAGAAAVTIAIAAVVFWMMKKSGKSKVGPIRISKGKKVRQSGGLPSKIKEKLKKLKLKRKGSVRYSYHYQKE